VTLPTALASVSSTRSGRIDAAFHGIALTYLLASEPGTAHAEGAVVTVQTSTALDGITYHGSQLSRRARVTRYIYYGVFCMPGGSIDCLSCVTRAEASWSTFKRLRRDRVLSSNGVQTA
jgi:hypothetical protein